MIIEFFKSLFAGTFNVELRYSLGFLLVSLIGAAVFKLVFKKTRVLKSFHILFLGAATSMGAIFWHIHSDVENWFHRLFDCLLSTLKAFGFEYTPKELIDMLCNSGMDKNLVDPIDVTYVSVVSFFAVSMTAFVALSIFKDSAAQLKYTFSFWKKAFVFSELNEKSICLAQDIRKKNRFSKIVFTSVDRIGSDEASQGLVFDAENINAIMTRKSVVDFHCKNIRELNIYLIDLEESNNIKNGIDYYKKHMNRKCKIHIFSTLESSEGFVDNIVKYAHGQQEKKINVCKQRLGRIFGSFEKKKSDKKSRFGFRTWFLKMIDFIYKPKAIINLVNRAQIIAYDLMMRYPMYKAADRRNSKTMSVLIIGAGTIGMECAKAAMWCGRMNNYGIKIRIVDTVDRKNEFEAKYADFKKELGDAGVKIKDEKSDIEFYSFDVHDVTDTAFNVWLEDNKEANYIIVATGNDERNILTATKVRRHFIRLSVENDLGYNPDSEPVIIPIISNPDYYGIMDEFNADCSSFCPYGSHFNIYNSETVNNWAIDALAKKIHEKYRDVQRSRGESYIADEYDKLSQGDKRSNRANAVHVIYKLKDAGVELCSDKPSINADTLTLEYRKTDDFRVISRILDLEENGKTRRQSLVELEHERWVVFNVLDGWICMTKEQIKSVFKEKEGKWQHKLPEAMLHGSIVETSKLADIGSDLKKNDDYFIAYDRDLTEIAEKDFVPFAKEILDKSLSENIVKRLIGKIRKEKKPHLYVCVKNNDKIFFEYKK